MKKQLPGWAVLLIITLVAGLALGATYALTKEPIARQALAQAENARKAALPEADAFEQLTLAEDAPVDWAYAGLKTAQDGSTAIVGHVSQITVKGYKGPVEVTVGLDNDLTLTGISVGGSEFAETAGLGAKAKEPAFQEQFAGKKTPVSVIKQGGTPGDNTVDAITAATITSNAVRDAVNSVAKFIRQDVMGAAEIEMPPRPEDSLVFSAKEKGFAGPVYVEAAFDGAGKITYIGIGDDEFNETPGFGAAALEKENQFPFIGAQMPLALEDIDALTGATFTKTAVVNGLNIAYDASRGVTEEPAVEEPVVEEPAVEEPAVEEPAAEEPAAEEPIVEEPAAQEPAAEEPLAEEPAVEAPASLPEADTDPGYTGQSIMFFTAVKADAAFENGVIADLALSEKAVGSSEYTPMAMALQDTLKAQLVGKAAPVSADIITGVPAYTASAVALAVNNAYALYAGNSMPEASPAAGEQRFTGVCVMFFDRYTVSALFDGDLLSEFDLTEAPVGGKEASALETGPLMDALKGQRMPLSAADYTAAGTAPYTLEAVVIALNEAYAQSLAGQQ